MLTHNGYCLGTVRNIAVLFKLGHCISAGQKALGNRAVTGSGYDLIHTVARNTELNAGNIAVLGGLDDLCSSVGFCVKLKCEHNRVFRAAHHRLFRRAAPDKNVVVHVRNVLLGTHRYNVGEHSGRSKGVFVSASANRDTVSVGKSKVSVCVVGIGQCKRILFGRCIVLKGMRLSGKTGCNQVIGHLFQNPVIALFRRSAFNSFEVAVTRNTVAIRSNFRGTGSELLLILPNDDLCCKCIIIIVCSGNLSLLSLLPTIHGGQHNTFSCCLRQILKIPAVRTAG